MFVIALDPGNSTGWCARDRDGGLIGGTAGENHKHVYDLLCHHCPDVVVYETFQMYPGKAQKLIWNTFYPCEVIGVIKYWAMEHNVKIVGLQPSVKKFALGCDEVDLWKTVERYGAPATEHMRDAVRLLRYFERNRSSFIPDKEWRDLNRLT